MTNFEIVLQETKILFADPVTREMAALQRAQQKGLVRMLDPVKRAYEQADALGIQFYSEQLERYLQVVQKFQPLLTTVPLPVPTTSAPVETVQPPLTTQPQVPLYIVSPLTLATAYAQLRRHHPGTQEEPEWMLAVTGVKHEQMRTLEQLIEVKLAKQSAVTAAFDMQDFTRIATTLYEKSQALHAIFHSHRFRGQPQPSPVDWRLQEILDQGRYPAIQAVFSEDGYVRFFARRPFTVVVSGKGVDCVDPNTFLYRITHFGTLLESGNAA